MRSLANNNYGSGYYTITWNGKNEYGINVASGVYIYDLKTEEFNQTKRSIVLR